MSFTLPDLPYPQDALEPFISAETFQYHYGKHHQAYVNNLNSLTQGTDLAGKSLEELIKTQSGAIFNNAAQVWNHTFYFNGMIPGGSKAPTGEIADMINKSFGSLQRFQEDFTKAAVANFGSGWTWLIKNGDELEIMSTSNADCPLKHNKHPLLTCDVWEHAYYIDYRNARPKYLESWFNVINWDFVNNNL